jgi:hypothetical protein
MSVKTIATEDMQAALGRHLSGDWGEVGREDWQENELSLKEGFRLFSVYHDRNGVGPTHRRILGRVGCAHRRAQGDRSTLRSIRPEARESARLSFYEERIQPRQVGHQATG